MPIKFEHMSSDPKYPDIVLVTPAWGEISRERRRSIAQTVEHKTRKALLLDEEAKQNFLSPYWTPKRQGKKEEEICYDSKQNEPSPNKLLRSDIPSNSISDSRASTSPTRKVNDHTIVNNKGKEMIHLSKDDTIDMDDKWL